MPLLHLLLLTILQKLTDTKDSHLIPTPKTNGTTTYSTKTFASAAALPSDIAKIPPFHTPSVPNPTPWVKSSMPAKASPFDSGKAK